MLTEVKLGSEHFKFIFTTDAFLIHEFTVKFPLKSPC